MRPPMYPSASCPLSRRILNIRLRKASITSPSTSSFSSFWAMLPSLSSGMRRRGHLSAAAANHFGRSAGDDDVRRFGALLALARLELDARTLDEALEAIAGDVAEVHEQILRPLVRGDEPVALRVVEPLHGSGCHMKNTSLTHVHEQVGRRLARTGLALVVPGKGSSRAVPGTEGAWHPLFAFLPGLVQQRAEVERPREHPDRAVGCRRPLVPRPVAVQLDAVAVRVAEVDRLADAVVRGALERDSRVEHVADGLGERL